MNPDQLDIQVVLQFLALPLAALKWPLQGSNELVILKSVLFILPVLLIIVAFWTTALSLPTLLFRQDRTKYSASLLITWFESFRAIILFWAGIGKFFFLSIGWIFGSIRIIIMGIYQTIKDIIFSPVTILSQMAKNYSRPGIPWIAVTITFFWIGLEAGIFSFVLGPLITDILYGMTNVQLHPSIISIGLFLFLFMVVGGSLACMHALVEAIEERNFSTIIKMIIIEVIVAAVEVVFFYREFVEAVLPFFNRMSEDGMHLGPIAILSIGFFAWFGIRSSTWFFFAKYGTPTLLMIIAREGISEGNPQNKKVDSVKFPIGKPMTWIKQLVQQLQEEIHWFEKKGQEMIDAFFVPPMQIVAVMANFFMLLLTGKHLINIPLKSVNDIKDTKSMLHQINHQEQQKNSGEK